MVTPVRAPTTAKTPAKAGKGSARKTATTSHGDKPNSDVFPPVKNPHRILESWETEGSWLDAELHHGPYYTSWIGSSPLRSIGITLPQKVKVIYAPMDGEIRIIIPERRFNPVASRDIELETIQKIKTYKDTPSDHPAIKNALASIAVSTRILYNAEVEVPDLLKIILKTDKNNSLENVAKQLEKAARNPRAAAALAPMKNPSAKPFDLGEVTGTRDGFYYFANGTIAKWYQTEDPTARNSSWGKSYDNTILIKFPDSDAGIALNLHWGEITLEKAKRFINAVHTLETDGVSVPKLISQNYRFPHNNGLSWREPPPSVDPVLFMLEKRAEAVDDEKMAPISRKPTKRSDLNQRDAPLTSIPLPGNAKDLIGDGTLQALRKKVSDIRPVTNVGPAIGQVGRGTETIDPLKPDAEAARTPKRRGK